MSETILEIRNLFKNYGNVVAIENVSFKIKKGDFFCLLGQNGAGKSTIINIISGILKSNSGMVYINNESDSQHIREKIGVVYQNNVLDAELTVKQNLMIRGSLYLKSRLDIKTRYNELVKEFDLNHLENRKYKTLSGGQKRKIELIRALFSRPEILLLDEPTTGLDPETRREVWKSILKLKTRDELTIFLTTHYLEETEDSDHIIMIHKGKIIAEGTPKDLKNKLNNNVLFLETQQIQNLIKILNDIGVSYKNDLSQFIIQFKDIIEMANIINLAKDIIENVEIRQTSMDDVFLNLIKGEQSS